jgi:putative glutamine amidotransferase
VALGGTLRRDTSDNDDLIRHHAPDDTAFAAMFDHHHSVALAPNGKLAHAFGKAALSVSSVHYQGVGTLASGLAIEATAPDGLVEAFSARVGHSDVLAVQWHPEWDAATNPDSQLYFQMLGRALRGQDNDHEGQK